MGRATASIGVPGEENPFEYEFSVSNTDGTNGAPSLYANIPIINIKENYDLIIIVGDKLSNNSKQLYELAKKKTNAILIESILDLDINELLNKENIAITSGASTPSSIVDQIYNFILNFDKDNKKTHIIPNIDYSNILKEFKK